MPTVHELRNEIREAVDRFERVEPTSFTKEDLAAICDAVGYDINQHNFPPTSEMRAGILRNTGIMDEMNPNEAPSSFRKDELEAIHAFVTNDEE